jgi:hypothetical protein
MHLYTLYKMFSETSKKILSCPAIEGRLLHPRNTWQQEGLWALLDLVDKFPYELVRMSL